MRKRCFEDKLRHLLFSYRISQVYVFSFGIFVCFDQFVSQIKMSVQKLFICETNLQSRLKQNSFKYILVIYTFILENVMNLM